jgi:transcription initiation factor TFIIF subunit alpha
VTRDFTLSVMSASPPVRPSGRTPNGAHPPFIRRPKADPLVRPKKRQPRRPHPPSRATALKINGVAIAGNKSNTNAPQNGSLSATSQVAQPTVTPASSIWSQPPGENVKEFPLVTTKRALLEGLRHHVARFSSNKLIDPFNERDFTRPVRLHRRDPRAPPAGAGGTIKDEDTDMVNADSKEAMLDDKERERQEILRLEKEAQRQADLAQIAPSVNTGPSNNQKKQPFKKKTQQVFRNDISAEAQAQSKLRYEEALPWHLEDFDNKNTWVGNYESALSGTYVMLVLTNTGFEMVSLEKWYKFTPKNQFKALTIEEAEARMGQKVKEPRWFMDSQREHMRKKEEEQNKKAGSKLFLGKWERAPTGRAGAAIKSEFAEADDLDYEEDRFADDEENQLFEGDADETKEAEDRIKRDQLQANIFDLKDEKEYDKEDELEKRETELSKKLGKKIRKTLVKQEKNYVYDTDSDDNPYSSSVSEVSSSSYLITRISLATYLQNPRATPIPPKRRSAKKRKLRRRKRRRPISRRKSPKSRTMRSSHRVPLQKEQTHHRVVTRLLTPSN